MSPPLVPFTSGWSHTDPTAPLSRWTIDGTYPTKQEKWLWVRGFGQRLKLKPKMMLC
jgi:hypothetical protein